MMETVQKSTKNKIRPFGRTCAVYFRWLFLVLLTVILLGGLYIRVPWKILMLDAVFLALITVVPREKRKYGWLTLATAALAVTAWIFMPKKNAGNWRPYTFDMDVAALNAKYGIPHEDNAAPYYEQIEVTDFYGKLTFKDMRDFNHQRKGPDLWDPNDQTLSRPWKAAEFPELAEWLETEKQKIAPFWEAIKFNKCWFQIRTDPDAAMEAMQRDSTIKKTAIIIQRMIYQDLGNHDVQGAVNKSLGILQCSFHLQQQASLIDNLMGWSVYSLSASIIRDMVAHHNLNEDSLKMLQTQLGRFEWNWNELVNRFLDYEEVLSRNLMGSLFEINDQGDIRYTRKPDPLSEFFPSNVWGDEEQTKQSSAFWQARKVKLQLLIRWMTYPQSLKEMVKVYDEEYARLRKQLTEDTAVYEGPVTWLDLLRYNLTLQSLVRLYTDLYSPSLTGVHSLFKRIEIKKAGTLIVISLKHYFDEYGDWPQNLEELKKTQPGLNLTDPLNNMEFIYKKTDTDFVLYSKGQNGIDEGGSRINDADIMIWPEEQ